MKISMANFNLTFVNNQKIRNNKLNHKTNTKSLTFHNDSYTKTNIISFNGSSNVENKGDLVAAMTALGVAGTFWMGLIVAIGVAKQGEKGQDIFFDEDGYKINTEEKTLDSEYVKADIDDGILQVKGTGIDIRPERFTEVDIKNGVYKNPEKGIDIDLNNNKYIDPENEILFDPETKMSAIMTDEGMKFIGIPDFSFGTRGGNWWSGPRSTGGSYEPSMSDKISDFFENIFDKQEKVKIDHVPVNDIYGREIIKSFEPDGQIRLTAIPDRTNEIFKDFLNKGHSTVEAAEMTHAHNYEMFKFEHPLWPSLPFGTRLDRNPYMNMDRSPQELEPKYDKETVQEVINKIKNDSDYRPDVDSKEAIEFFKFQQISLLKGDIKQPLIEQSLLISTAIDTDEDGIIDGFDKNGDGESDISLDINGDGSIDIDDAESLGSKIIELFKNIF